MRLKTFILGVMFFGFSFGDAQELSPIKNYIPEVYGAENQNWKICQTENKNIYFANNKGLLEFNGANWRLFPSPNKTILRAVNAKGDRVYTGSYREFGFWESDEYNNLIYKSLSDKIQDKLLEDEEIWKIVFFDKWTLFQSLHRIYIYNEHDQTFQIITSENNLPKIFKVDQQIYFQKMGEGLFRLLNGNPVLVSEDEMLKNKIIVNIFSWKNTDLLIETQDKGFYHLQDDKLLKWKTASDEVIEKLNVYSSIRLKDSTFVLGTIGNGLYRLSSNGKIIGHINQSKGLLNNTVLSVFEDADNNLWLGLDNGISVLNFSSPFLVYNDIEGMLGAVYASAYYNKILYLGTNQGLFYKEDDTDDFTFVEGTEGQVWVLKTIDDKLFCGHNSGTFIVERDKVKQVSQVMGTWNLKPVKGKQDLILQGNYEGLHLLEKKDGQWRYKNKIAGFDMSSRFFELTDTFEILVSHEYKGVFSLKPSDDFQKFITVDKMINIPMGSKSGMITYDEKIFYFAPEGMYRYDEQLKEFKKDSVYTTLVLGDDTYISGKMMVDESNHLWLFTEQNIVRLTSGKLDDYPQKETIPLTVALRHDIPSFENILKIKTNDYLLGTSEGYIRLKPNDIKMPEYTIQINAITNNRVDEKAMPVALKNNGDEIFRHKQNNFYFSYHVPFYGEMYSSSYQYALVGLSSQWSEWSQKSSVSFENLPPGSYTFKVRAKIGNTYSENIATYNFTITKPWYSTNLMLAVYVLMLILTLVFFKGRYKLRYKKQKEKIESEKNRELTLLQLETDKTLMKLRNDKLRSEVEGKNRELATSTMSIVKKNELLNTIKNELKSERANPHVKTVLNIIEENIGDNSDWESFKEAFNNTDRDFLKKLKEEHPELTPNDLKLCVYLRLNLSSKEIAPMLSISSRSVEVKRYRLRKKMKLKHDKNLTDYILGL